MNPTSAGTIAPVELESLPEYSPTTYVDFTQPAHRAEFEKALADVRAMFGRDYPLVIGGRRENAPGTFESTNPAKPSEVLGRFQSATTEQAARAVDVAFQAFRSWSRVPAGERAAYLVEAAKRMRERRHFFSAWLVLEVGKSWGEADADTAEPSPGVYRPMSLREALEEPEKRILEAALRANGWNRQLTAEQLGINRTTLYKKMKRYGLDAEPSSARS